MKSDSREAIFFGSISCSILSVHTRNDYGTGQLKQLQGKISISASVGAPHEHVEETLGMTPSSEPFSVVTSPCTPQTGPTQLLFLPVLLEMGREAACSTQTADINPTYVEGIEEVDPTSTDPLAKKVVCASAALEVKVKLSMGTAAPVTAGLKKVILRSLNHEAEKELCTIVRVDVSNDFLQKNVPAATTATETVYERDLGLSVYVLVRVIDLSQTCAAVLEADRLLRQILNKPDPVPQTLLSFAKKTQTPYGCMPLVTLYDHYRLFFSRIFGMELGHSKGIHQLLNNASDSTAEDNYPYRWCTVRKINLNTLLLGEEACTPLLTTLAHCSNLTHLLLTRNGLGDLSCARICALFSRHRYLSHVSLDGNRLHEGGADQLLRLLRRNHRIVWLSLQGCYCSDSLQERIQKVVKVNASNIAKDPLNLFTHQYDSLTTPETLLPAAKKLALGVWAMLSAAAVGDVDVWVRNSTTKALVDLYVDDSEVPRLEATSAAAEAGLSVIPAAAKAPLLSEVIRTVSIGVSRVVQDPLVRSVFSDVEEAPAFRKAQVEARDKMMEKESPEVAEMLKKVFHPQTVTPPSEEAIYASSFLRVVVVTARAVAMQVSWPEAEKTLREIGKAQRTLGVRWEDYWLSVHVFAKALYVCCGSEEHATARVAAFLSMMAIGVRIVGEALQDA
ncbi:hypothetical protein AGDE_05237 [Angomonas deanei]|nr:hypothetical protein AGDE_05237 [Angomonas deanei]|eukprot:EPY38692.1 hypothetical protein AGDE_05237 [Angomonas deanei]